MVIKMFSPKNGLGVFQLGVAYKSFSYFDSILIYHCQLNCIAQPLDHFLPAFKAEAVKCLQLFWLLLFNWV
jgi:hypothetical protein